MDRSRVPSSNWKTAGMLSGNMKGDRGSGVRDPDAISDTSRVLLSFADRSSLANVEPFVGVPNPRPIIICTGWQVGVMVGVIVGVAVGGVLVGTGVTKRVLQEVAPRTASLY